MRGAPIAAGIHVGFVKRKSGATGFGKKEATDAWVGRQVVGLERRGE
jgi:hypothetical protein